MAGKQTKPRNLTGKQELFSKYIFMLGSETFGNGVKSAQKAGYKGSYAVLNQIAIDNLHKPIIIREKQRIQTETEEKLDLSREKQHKKLELAFTLAVKTESPSAMVSAIREQNEMLGYHRDKSPNTERESAKLKRMSEETKRLAQQLALLLTRKQVVSKELTTEQIRS